MQINRIVPMDVKERICIHCNEKGVSGDPITYLIAESHQGKSTETIRQAVFRRLPILSTEYDFYKTAGMKHISEAKPGEVCFMGVRDVMNLDERLPCEGPLHICVDNGKEILEELLSARFNIPIKIDYMSLEG